LRPDVRDVVRPRVVPLPRFGAVELRLVLVRFALLPRFGLVRDVEEERPRVERLERLAVPPLLDRLVPARSPLIPRDDPVRPVPVREVRPVVVRPLLPRPVLVLRAVPARPRVVPRVPLAARRVPDAAREREPPARAGALPAPCFSSTVSRLTSLLKRLTFPPAVLS
jgi:hypothetical protein